MHRSCLWTNRAGKIYNLKYERDVKFKRINSQGKRQRHRNGIRDVYFYILGYENDIHIITS